LLACVPHPYRPTRWGSSRQNEPPRRATCRRLELPRGFPRRTPRRCFLPTSATDTRSRVLATRSTRERGAFAARPTPRDVATQRIGPHRPRGQAPSHLAATRPQVDARLTARLELRFRRARFSVFRREPDTVMSGIPVPRRFRPRARLAAETSDAPCRVSVGSVTRTIGEPEPLSPPSRQGGRLSRLRAPSVNRCLRSPLSRNSENPPPIPRLCRRDPASDTFSPRNALARRG